MVGQHCQNEQAEQKCALTRAAHACVTEPEPILPGVEFALKPAPCASPAASVLPSFPGAVTLVRVHGSQSGLYHGASLYVLKLENSSDC